MWSLAFVLCAQATARAGGGAHNVILIVDPDDPNAVYIANYYRNARNVPERNIFYFKPGAANYASFVTDKLDSLFGMLATREINDHIDFILISATNQYRYPITGGLISDTCFPLSNFSLTAGYTLAHQAAMIQAGGISVTETNHYALTTSDTAIAFHSYANTNGGYWNGNFNGSGSAQKYFITGMLGYTGTGGNTLSEITAMIDNSVAADFSRLAGSATPPKTFYFVKTNDTARSGPRDGFFGAAAASINSAVADPFAAVALDLSTAGGALPPNAHDCMGVMTGAAFPGINASTNTILPGAFCDHLTSFAGDFSDTSQEKMSAWIRKGAAGTSGAVEEPCNYAGKFPHPRLHVYYVKQLTLGEAWFRSVAYLPFQSLLYGDVLCQPFSLHPTMMLPTPQNPADGSTVSGTLTLFPTFTTTRSGYSVRSRLFINGKFHSYQNLSGGTYVIDTTTLPDGVNEFRAISYDFHSNPAFNTENQFRRIRNYVVNNFGRAAEVTSVSPASGGRSTKFDITVNASGGTLREIRLMSNERVFAASTTVPKTFSLHGETIGPGPVALYAVAEFTDGRLALSPKIDVSVAFDAGPTPGPQTAAPTAYAFSKDIPANKPFILELPATDPDTTSLVYNVTQGPSAGTISGTGRTRLVRPTALALSDTVVFNVGDGTTNSAPAMITLRYTAPSVIGTQPNSASACVGGSANFSVVATGQGPFTYQWRKNGVDMVGKTSATLNISPIVIGDAATYTCLVTGALRATLSNPAVLSVSNGTPAVSSQPSNQSVCPGQPASFTVAASGTNLSYSWRRNMQVIPAASQPTYSIASASTNNAGTYDCVVSNPCGSATSDPAVLTVSNPAGDMNGDCSVNAADTVGFMNVLLGVDTDPQNRARADLNGDGVPDGRDIQVFVNSCL